MNDEHEHKIWEWQKAMDYLDERGIPTYDPDTEVTYSLLGRIKIAEGTHLISPNDRRFKQEYPATVEESFCQET